MKHRFKLSKTPLANIISVHVCNMINTPGISEEELLRHIQNLLNTYNSVVVEAIIQDVFPKFYKRIFNRKVA